MTPFAEPFCDNLRLTFPLGEDGGSPPVFAAVMAYLKGFCGYAERLDGKSWDCGAYGGVLYAGKQFGIFAMQFSGGLLRTLREGDALRELVMLLNEYPCTVTRLDASCDYAVSAPDYLASLYYRIRRESIVLGQKVVSYRDVERHTSVNAEGRQVHNLYLGKKTAEIRVLVYDKRHEQVSKGKADIGNMLRVEVRLKSQVRCTLFDALSPERVYYHYAAPALVSLPESVRPWEANGQGFEVQRKQSNFTTYERLKLLVEESASIKQALRLIARADSGGMVAFMHLLEHRMAADALPSLSDGL